MPILFFQNRGGLTLAYCIDKIEKKRHFLQRIKNELLMLPGLPLTEKAHEVDCMPVHHVPLSCASVPWCAVQTPKPPLPPPSNVGCVSDFKAQIAWTPRLIHCVMFLSVLEGYCGPRTFVIPWVVAYTCLK